MKVPLRAGPGPGPDAPDHSTYALDNFVDVEKADKSSLYIGSNLPSTSACTHIARKPGSTFCQAELGISEWLLKHSAS